MADNTQLNVGMGGDVIKTEDVGLFKIPVSKIYVGAAGVDGGPVTATNPLPVSVGNFPATQAVSGSVSLIGPVTTSANLNVGGDAVAASNPVPISIVNSQGVAVDWVDSPYLGDARSAAGDQGMSLLAVRKDTAASLVANDDSYTALIVDALNRLHVNVGNTVAVSGSVSVGNFPETQPVSGTVSITGAVMTAANLNVDGAAVASDNPVPVTSVGALPAGSNTIGAVISQLATGVVYDGSTGLTPKFAAISASAAGENLVVAAVAGKKIRVLKYTIVTSGAVAAKFRTSSGADLTGAMALAANSGVGGAFCPVGLLETAVGDALTLNLSTGAGIAGHLTYIEV